MKKKVISIALVIALIAVIAAGSFAYFTDKDSATNTFTVGKVDITLDETFTQNSKLMPGINVNKDVQISVAKDSEAAYVWYLWKIPADLDSIDGTTGTNNALHVNALGSTWDKYRENSKYWAGDQTEALPENETWDHDPETELGLTAGPEGYLYTETIEGVEYHVYAALYHGIVNPGESTNQAMTKVYLDKSVNCDETGYYQIYNKGENAGQKHYLSSLKNGVSIIVEAYGIQAAGFNDVYEAYAAYQLQK